MRLDGASALVTGGASGLGAAAAARLARMGMHVTVLDLPEAVQAAEPRAGIRYVAGDVTSESDVVGAVAFATAVAPLRVTVSCAGTGTGMRMVRTDMTRSVATFERVIRVNLLGTYTVMAYSAEAMSANTPDTEGQRGVVITTASITAFDGQAGQTAYASSKSGVAGLTLPAARELAAQGIRVNSVAPGVIDTPMMAAVSDEVRSPLVGQVLFPRRLGRPDEFAQVVTMIAENDYMNGEVVRVDGGLRMPP